MSFILWNNLHKEKCSYYIVTLYGYNFIWLFKIYQVH